MLNKALCTVLAKGEASELFGAVSIAFESATYSFSEKLYIHVEL